MKKQTKAKPRPAYGHLSHRSYTGKRLAKQHTNYPILIFLLLCLGIFMFGLTLNARAADVSVNATSNGPPPPAPAIITSPTEGTRFTSVPITVKGTCPARFMVKLYRNDVFSGAMLCALDDTFQIQTDLFEGANDLRARVFNAVGDEGPTSPSIRVYYDRPVTPATPATPTTSTPSPSAGVEPLLIKADNLYKGYYTGDEISWPLDIIGGTSPYALSIDWGDGNTSIFSRKQSGPFSINHVYSAAGPVQDSYIIKLTASDVNNTKTFLQLTVIVHDRNNVAVATPGSTSSRGGLAVPSLFWSLYGVTLLMALSFWLGQRREFLRLKPQLRAHK